jgi:CRISPR/Cas system-associated exonuclease Cas4 (RecB family)
MKSIKALKSEVVEKKVENPVLRKTADQIEEELIGAIDSSFHKRNVPVFKQVDGFHPSYTNQCARYWYYLFNGVELTTSFNPQTYRIFDNGHAVHDRIYSYFKDMGILVAEEIPVTHEDPPISGTADGIIDFYGNKLIELKSISMEGFEYRRIYKKPKDEHYRQAQIYMRCLDLDSGFVIYENKNNQEIMPLMIERDDDFIDELFKKYRKVYQNYKDGSKPKRPYKSINSKQCSMCDVRSMCWSEIDEWESF